MALEEIALLRRDAAQLERGIAVASCLSVRLWRWGIVVI